MKHKISFKVNTEVEQDIKLLINITIDDLLVALSTRKYKTSLSSKFIYKGYTKLKVAEIIDSEVLYEDEEETFYAFGLLED